LISDLSKYYEATFQNSGRIFATFEALFIEAVKE